MWKIYILLNTEKRITYTGSTNEIQRRLKEHNTGKVESTKGFNKWVPIYIECYPTESEARKRERYLKTTPGRRYLKKVINPIIQKWMGNN